MLTTKIVILILICNKFKAHGSQSIESKKEVNCEPLIGECRDQGWLHTILSSTYNHEEDYDAQKIADSMIKSFDVLLPCSNYMKLFLCAIYKPACYEDAALVIRPCKSMCEHVYARCFPLMNKFHIKWNQDLNCSNFLDHKTQRCINDPYGYNKDLSENPSSKENNFMNQIENMLNKLSPIYETKSQIGDNNKVNYILKEKYSCLKTFNFTKQKCILKCNTENLFTLSEKNLAGLFQLVLQIFSIICSLFTIFNVFPTFGTNLNFPICAFFFHSLGQVFLSFNNLIYYFMGHESFVCKKLISNNDWVNLDQSNLSQFCIISSLISYFFKMFNYTNWLILSLFWSLSVLVEIDTKTLNSYIRSYFHVLSILLPLIKTLIILNFRNIGDVDELNGICSIGASNSNHLFYLIILPSSFYLIVGLLLLLAAFCKILILKFRKNNKSCRFYSAIKQESSVKIGIMCFLSSVPILIVTGCELYEYIKSVCWSRLPITVSNPELLENYVNKASSRPNIIVFLLKMFANFSPSFSSLLFILIILKQDLKKSKSFFMPESNIKIENKANAQKTILKFNLKYDSKTKNYYHEPLFLECSTNNRELETPHYCMPYSISDGDSSHTICGCQRGNHLITTC
jgi:hypothetical protein